MKIYAEEFAKPALRFGVAFEDEIGRGRALSFVRRRRRHARGRETKLGDLYAAKDELREFAFIDKLFGRLEGQQRRARVRVALSAVGERDCRQDDERDHRAQCKQKTSTRHNA